MNRDDAYLKAILREISSIPVIMKGYSVEAFMKSEKTQKAICMTLLNIGELVKGISDDLKCRYPDIPWKEIAGLRDITAHKYHSLNMERVWTTAKKDILELKLQIINMLKDE